MGERTFLGGRKLRLFLELRKQTDQTAEKQQLFEDNIPS
jgi:hypothetical protein